MAMNQKVTDLIVKSVVLKRKVGGQWLAPPENHFLPESAYCLDITVGNQDGKIRYRSRYEFIPAAGLGLRMASGIIRIGYVFQWVNMLQGDLTVPETSKPMGYNVGVFQGSAMSHNAGLAISLPIYFLPAVNFVARNIGNARYSSFTLLKFANRAAGPPPDEPMSFDASLSIQPKIFTRVWTNLVAEYRDISNTSGVPLSGRFALGAELSIADVIMLRGGWGSGYPSFGIGFQRPSGRGELSLSMFSESVGNSYHEIHDTLYMLHYRVRAF